MELVCRDQLSLIRRFHLLAWKRQRSSQPGAGYEGHFKCAKVAESNVPEPVDRGNYGFNRKDQSVPVLARRAEALLDALSRIIHSQYFLSVELKTGVEVGVAAPAGRRW